MAQSVSQNCDIYLDLPLSLNESRCADLACLICQAPAGWLTLARWTQRLQQQEWAFQLGTFQILNPVPQKQERKDGLNSQTFSLSVGKTFEHPLNNYLEKVLGFFCFGSTLYFLLLVYFRCFLCRVFMCAHLSMSPALKRAPDVAHLWTRSSAAPMVPN